MKALIRCANCGVDCIDNYLGFCDRCVKEALTLKNLDKKVTPLPPEFSKAVDEHFWELLDK